MKLEIEQKQFYEGINIVRKAVSTQTTLPILSGILLKTEGDKLKLAGTDLEMGIEYFVEANIIKEGAIVLPARYFSGIIKELPNEKIILEMNSATNSVFLKCGNSKFNINGSPADEFPLLPKIDANKSFKMEQNKLQLMIEQVDFAVSKDDGRPFLTGGLLLAEDGEIKLITTDTYRLAYRKSSLNQEDINVEDIIIPGQTLSELRRLLTDTDEEVEICVTDNQILFSFAGISFHSRLIEGNFPNYKYVIPNTNKSKVEIDKNELLHATRRASLLAREDANIVKFNFGEDKVTITANAPEVGQAYEEVPNKLTGQETEIAFNANYLLDVLKVIDEEEVVLELSGPLSPGVIKNKERDDYIYVIMPVRSA